MRLQSYPVSHPVGPSSDAPSADVFFTFFTLFKISPLLATLSRKHPGYAGIELPASRRAQSHSFHILMQTPHNNSRGITSFQKQGRGDPPEFPIRESHKPWGRHEAWSRKANDDSMGYWASWLARISCHRRGRLFDGSTFFRRRMVFGVISTYSSSAMNSMACSRLSSLCGINRIASSAVEDRMFVSFFSFVTFTSISCSRVFSPTIMPSYTSLAGPMKSSPRSCRFHSAKAVD